MEAMTQKRGHEHEHCWYCGAVVCERSGVGDHMPLPKRHGGELTVPCCVVCHDMKDRIPLKYWPMNWTVQVLKDFPKVSRETRLFLAKAMAIWSDGQRDSEPQEDLSYLNNAEVAHALLAESEYAERAERGREGVRAARRNGKRIGRPSKRTAELVARVQELRHGGMTDVQIAASTGVSRSSVQRVTRLAAKEPDDPQQELFPCRTSSN